MIFGSGMAAISTSLMALLRAGDHIVFQQSLYGGTYHFAHTQLRRYGMDFSFTDGTSLESLRRSLSLRLKLFIWKLLPILCWQ